MDLRVVERLVDAQASAQDQIEQRASDAALARLDSVTEWGDPAQVAAVGVALGAYARSAAARSAALTDAYLARVLTEVTGRAARPVGAINLATPLRSGAEGYAQVYWRVTTTARIDLADGATREHALDLAKGRADAMIRTDAAMARREQARQVFSADTRVTGYRRVIRPEMSKTGVCGLCIAAANQKYNRAELLPLHDRCKCTVLPITGGHDPGGTLNQKDFADAYALAESTSARDLKEVRVRYEDHSELGPRLVPATQRSANPGRNRALRDEAGREPVQRPDTRESSQAFLAAARDSRRSA